MTVDIRFYDEDDNELSLDNMAGGHDFGICRKNQPYVVPIKIKNLGDSDAKNITISASPLNSSIEVTPEEYAKQQLSATWKSFSLLPDERFENELSLPDISAGESLVGIKKIIDDFKNPQVSNWTPRNTNGITWRWTGERLQASGSTPSYFTAIDAVGLNSLKDCDVVFNFNQPANETSGSVFTMLGFRMNSIGNEKGYMLNLKRTKTSTVNNGYFEIRICAGVKANGGTDFGSILARTDNFNWTDFMDVRVKIFTNSNNLPEIKIWVGNILDTDATIKIGNNDSWVDTSNTLPNAGLVSMVFGTAIGGVFEVENTKVYTSEPNGNVYIRTIVGDGASDQEEYKSALELYYDPPEV